MAAKTTRALTTWANVQTDIKVEMDGKGTKDPKMVSIGINVKWSLPRALHYDIIHVLALT